KAVGVDEALAPRRRLRSQRVGRQRGHDPGRQPQCVDELAGGVTRVHVDSVNGEGHLDRAERLVLELADLRAVDRVRAQGAEPLYVEQRSSHADLLVWSERDPQTWAR